MIYEDDQVVPVKESYEPFMPSSPAIGVVHYNIPQARYVVDTTQGIFPLMEDGKLLW